MNLKILHVHMFCGPQTMLYHSLELAGFVGVMFVFANN